MDDMRVSIPVDELTYAALELDAEAFGTLVKAALWAATHRIRYVDRRRPEVEYAIEDRFAPRLGSDDVWDTLVDAGYAIRGDGRYALAIGTWAPVWLQNGEYTLGGTVDLPEFDDIAAPGKDVVDGIAAGIAEATDGS